ATPQRVVGSSTQRSPALSFSGALRAVHGTAAVPLSSKSPAGSRIRHVLVINPPRAHAPVSAGAASQPRSLRRATGRPHRHGAAHRGAAGKRPPGHRVAHRPDGRRSGGADPPSPPFRTRRTAPGGPS